jgi:hypothetical protein
MLSLWFLHHRPEYGRTRLFGAFAAVIVLLTPFTGHGVLLTGMILAGLVALKLVMVKG